MATDNTELHKVVDSKLKAEGGHRPIDEPEPERDQWGRYMLPGQNAGRTRASTLSGMAKDPWGLVNWKVKMAAVAVHGDASLMGDDPDKVNVDTLLTAAGCDDAADKGTAMHRVMFHVLNESAQHIPKSLTIPLPSGGTHKITKLDERVKLYLATLDEFGFKPDPQQLERILSGQGYAGTSDGQLVSGEHFDWKAGKRMYGGHDYAVQMALYANAPTEWYPTNGGWRSQNPRTIEPNTDIGYVFHIPVEGSPRMDVYKVDLRAGWNAYQNLIAPLRQYRDAGVMRRVLAEDVLPIEIGPDTVLRDYGVLLEAGHKAAVIEAFTAGKLPGPKLASSAEPAVVMEMHDALQRVADEAGVELP